MSIRGLSRPVIGAYMTHHGPWVNVDPLGAVEGPSLFSVGSQLPLMGICRAPMDYNAGP